MTQKIRIQLLNEDALEVKADVLALKHAQALHGVDRSVVAKLHQEPKAAVPGLPKDGEFAFVNSEGVLASERVLFVGVPSIHQFGYVEIRRFGERVLSALADEYPDTRHVVLTIHGPGFGLDETEAFEAEIAGLADAVLAEDVPKGLELISIAERNLGRFERLTFVLKRLCPKGVLVEVGGDRDPAALEASQRLRDAGIGAAGKHHAFIAMPFEKELEDVFYFGIRPPVEGRGLLCERADTEAFTGPVMDWLKERIASCDIFIADLSGANPNVYLEVGYAWGLNRRTVLIINSASELEFDVRGHRCLEYQTIHDLEEQLTDELKKLRI